MRFVARSAALGLAFFVTGFLSAESGERIPNWLAPPFWMPSMADFRKSAMEARSGFAAQAVEAVPTPALAFTGITPCRIADTRGNGFTGAYGPPSLTQGSPRNFTLTGQC
ncbi:MAG TPA: hypothetical protein VLE54_00100, partial [Thermoanaerobaculia bacterium]|nr:hypothetical protein [Thermoanaerobaculia bacterium]